MYWQLRPYCRQFVQILSSIDGPSHLICEGMRRRTSVRHGLASQTCTVTGADVAGRHGRLEPTAGQAQDVVSFARCSTDQAERDVDVPSWLDTSRRLVGSPSALARPPSTDPWLACRRRGRPLNQTCRPRGLSSLAGEAGGAARSADRLRRERERRAEIRSCRPSDRRKEIREDGGCGVGGQGRGASSTRAPGRAVRPPLSLGLGRLRRGPRWRGARPRGHGVQAARPAARDGRWPPPPIDQQLTVDVRPNRCWRSSDDDQEGGRASTAAHT
jgi:hypothetical protein